MTKSTAYTQDFINLCHYMAGVLHLLVSPLWAWGSKDKTTWEFWKFSPGPNTWAEQNAFHFWCQHSAKFVPLRVRWVGSYQDVWGLSVWKWYWSFWVVFNTASILRNLCLGKEAPHISKVIYLINSLLPTIEKKKKIKALK